MKHTSTGEQQHVVDREWVSFPGGELEARRPKVLCPACRHQLQAAAAGQDQRPDALKRKPLCFQCYRAELDRERALKGAGQIDTASAARFQETLPFEPVNQPRLQALKAERAAARVVQAQSATGRFVDRRRQAQLAARHALQQVAAGLRARQLAPSAREQAIASAIHAAELQLPESWMPFVVSR